MRESMAQLTPRFSASRTVREYAERYYIPAAAAFCERSALNGETGAGIVKWSHLLRDNWEQVRFGEVSVTTSDEQHRFQVRVSLGGITPEAVQVELYAEESQGGYPLRLEMKCIQQPAGEEHDHLYDIQIPAARPSGDFTVRIVPRYPGVAIPLEDSHILWQR
jgi:starch phosphorylase